VGGELARQWNLPPLLQDCIAHHHDIQQAQYCPIETAILHIANTLALMAEVDSTNLEDVPAIDPQAWAITGLEPGDLIESTIREAQEEFIDAQKLFLGN